MPPFKVAPCTLDDAPAIARNNISAFWEDKNWVLLWTRKGKSREYVISQSVHRWPYNLTKDPIHRRHEKVVNVDTGELVGFAVWILPGASGAGEEKSGTGEKEISELWPEARGPEVDDETLELLKKRSDEADWEFDHAMDVLDEPGIVLKKRLKGDKRWLVLNYLAVHPSHQRQGIATLLVESGIKAAEKMGLDIFISGTKAGRGVYYRSGFTLLGEIIQDDSEWGGDGEWVQAYFEKRVKK